MAKINKEKSGLKMLAADAKARLKNGYHNSHDTEDGQTRAESYFDLVKKSFSDKDMALKDKIFYDKVKKILEEGEIINPILRLVDEVYINSLSYSSKQRYLLEISEKYNRIKKEILGKKND